MKQYLDLLKTIQEKGTVKPAAREGMPGTTSLFGYQFRHNLADGFPLLTTKKMFWKGVVVELLWFLKGDTNIKYLIDNGVNIWNEDAYNYYCKFAKANDKKVDAILLQNPDTTMRMLKFDEFIGWVKQTPKHELPRYKNYQLGDCGYQYGRVWRSWEKVFNDEQAPDFENKIELIDQLKNLIYALKNNPESRRHIITAVDPAHETDLALYWCHAMFQFNCRPIPWETKLELAKSNPNIELENLAITEAAAGNRQFGVVPQYYLDCQLYQRSADVFLGVPFNIASYALLTELLAKICNMIPGEFIHTFGDVHIYNNHKEAVEEQLMRQPTQLPRLKLPNDARYELLLDGNINYNFIMESLVDYNPQGPIKAELSTGLKK